MADDNEFASAVKGSTNFKSDYLGLEFGIFINERFLVDLGVRLNGVRNADFYSERLRQKNMKVSNDKLYNWLFPVSLQIRQDLLKKETNKLVCFMEPGVVFQPFSSDRFKIIKEEVVEGFLQETKSYHTRNFHWLYVYANCQFGLQYVVDEDFALCLGYEITTQDPYKKRRGTVYDGVCFGDYMPEKKTFNHLVFVSLHAFF